MSTTTVKFKFVDVLGNALDDHSVIVDVFSLDNSTHFRAAVPLSGQNDVAIDLVDCSSGIYRFQLAPTNYQFLQFFLRLTEDETTMRKEPVVFPVDPDKVSDISAPAFDQLDSRLRDFLTGSTIKLNKKKGQNGADLYGSLPPILKAALLNLFTKSSNTKLGDETSCFDHIRGMLELDQDRLFAKSDAALLEETMQSKDFHSVDFSLHKEIPPYQIFSSFKTRDAQGNLQLTFS